MDDPVETVRDRPFVSDADYGLVPEYPEEVVEYLLFHLPVESGGELIEDQYRGIANEGACECDALFLTAGKIKAVPSEDGLVPFR
jgi:hypothetical protein